MKGVARFEDLQVWQKAKLLAVQVYQVTRLGGLARDFGLRDQMQRAAGSVMSNITEGFERHGPAEFSHFLSIARGSAAELPSQLYLAEELNYLTTEDFDRLHTLSVEVTRMLTSLRASLDRR